ncbi:MAG: hypothetical protein MK098_09025 [Marinovum sp.]|nr:hypothetical protein [Marinovum sp.]
MKYDRIDPSHADRTIPRQTAEEIEARVFCKLKARQKTVEHATAGRIVILQYPDTRTVFQRFAAWWHVRFQCRVRVDPLDTTETVKEPVWPGHWGASKYL